MHAMIWYLLIWFSGGFINGVTSFGGNLVAVPLLMLMMPPKDAIMLGIFCGSLICPTLMLLYFRHILWREAITLFIAQIPGLIAGVWILEKADARLLLSMAGTLLLLFLAWQIVSAKIGKSAKPISYNWIYLAGVCSGFMLSSTSFGGPPMALYSFLRKWPKEEVVATLCACGTFCAAILLPWLIRNEIFETRLMDQAIWGSFAVVLGILLSVPALRRIKTDLFRKLVFLMLLFSALLMLWRAIGTDFF